MWHVDESNKDCELTVLVTGAARGIGRAVVEMLCKEKQMKVFGMDVLSCEVGTMTMGEGSEYTHIIADVNDKSAFPDLPPLNYVFNNAGTDAGGTDDLSVIDTNLFGAFNIEDKYLNPDAKGFGALIAVVNNCSICALGGQDERLYCASKGALLSYTYYLANKLSQWDVRVNAVSPGPITTNMTQRFLSNPECTRAVAEGTLLGCWGRPKSVAYAVKYLLLDAEFVTGTNLVVDGGEMAKHTFIREDYGRKR